MISDVTSINTCFLCPRGKYIGKDLFSLDKLLFPQYSGNKSQESSHRNIARSIFSCESPFIIEDVNEEWCSVWGYSKQMLLGRNIAFQFSAAADEYAVSKFIESARLGYADEVAFVGKTGDGAERSVTLRSRPLCRNGNPTHFAIEIARSDGADDHDAFCKHMAALNVHGGARSCSDSGSDDSDADRGAAADVSFAELHLPLPPESQRRACIALLRRLRGLALVRGWRRDGAALRVRADAAALAALAATPAAACRGTADAWLHSLAEAARAARAAARRDRAAAGGRHWAGPWRGGRETAAAAVAAAEEDATDFSFLSCDGPRGSPQLVPVN